jgi:hypothetical protein
LFYLTRYEIKFTFFWCWFSASHQMSIVILLWNRFSLFIFIKWDEYMYFLQSTPNAKMRISFSPLFILHPFLIYRLSNNDETEKKIWWKNLCQGGIKITFQYEIAISYNSLLLQGKQIVCSNAKKKLITWLNCTLQVTILQIQQQFYSKF